MTDKSLIGEQILHAYKEPGAYDKEEKLVEDLSTSPWNAWCVRENRELLHKLYKETGAGATTCLRNFLTTPPGWFCPSCLRTKTQIARIDKNGRLNVNIVEHHDHCSDLASEIGAPGAAVTRFHPELICELCNNKEKDAKTAVGAVKHFSFSPNEIFQFVIVNEGQIVGVDTEAARQVYALSGAYVELMIERAKKVAHSEAGACKK